MKKIISFILLALFCIHAECEIYKATDKKTGKVVYTNAYPDAEQFTAIEIVGQKPPNVVGGNQNVDSANHEAVSQDEISQAFANRQSNIQVSGVGHVTKLLSDDDDGSRHQRFIIRLSSGQTLLVAHNIDLAEKISSLNEGDAVEFYGEYEWNAKGGVIHWTHKDPDGSHVAGWLKHRGQIYQ